MPNTIVLALICILLLAAGQSLLKVGLLKAGGVAFTGGQIWPSIRRILSVPHIVLGFFFYGISSGLWLDVLSKLELSVAFPMVSLTYVVTVAVGALFLDESVNLLRVVGVGLSCAGVFFVGRSR